MMHLDVASIWDCRPQKTFARYLRICWPAAGWLVLGGLLI